MVDPDEASRAGVSRLHYDVLLAGFTEAGQQGRLEEHLQFQYNKRLYRNHRRRSATGAEAGVDFAQLASELREAARCSTLTPDWLALHFPLGLDGAQPQAPASGPEARGPRSEVRAPSTEARAPNSEARPPTPTGRRRCVRVGLKHLREQRFPTGALELERGGATPRFVHRYCNPTGKTAMEFLTWAGLAEVPSCCPQGHEWKLGYRKRGGWCMRCCFYTKEPQLVRRGRRSGVSPAGGASRPGLSGRDVVRDRNKRLLIDSQ